MKYLGLTPGSVTPLGLINDTAKHVHLFLDENLLNSEKISFHPNINIASLVIPFKGFIKFLRLTGNSYEFIKMYE